MGSPRSACSKTRVRVCLAVCAAVVALTAVEAAPASITASGSWSVTIGQTNACTPAGCLPGCTDSCAAGNVLRSAYESEVDALTVSVDVDAEGVTYEVQVKRDNTWAGSRQDHDWAIFVSGRRTTGSGGCSTCTGGTEYQTLDTSYTTLFTLTANGSDIPIQLELTNFDIYCPIQAYASLLSFRLVRSSDGTVLATSSTCALDLTVERILYFAPGAAPGNQTTLTISAAAAGSPPTTVYTSDARYKITTNGTATDASQKITGQIGPSTPSGVSLAVCLASPGGGAYPANGGDYVVMSDTQAHDLILGLQSAAQKGLVIYCRLSATAAAGTVSLRSTDLTLTLVVS